MNVDDYPRRRTLASAGDLIFSTSTPCAGFSEVLNEGRDPLTLGGAQTYRCRGGLSIADLNTFIVGDFCFLDDRLRGRQRSYRRRGPSPKLSDSEVLTMEVVGE